MLIAGALWALFSLMLSAWVQHAIMGDISSLRIAHHYLLVHGAVVCGVGYGQVSGHLPRVSGWLLLMGSALFAMGVYASHWRLAQWGVMAPVGGVMMMLGWACMAFYGFKRRRETASLPFRE